MLNLLNYFKNISILPVPMEPSDLNLKIRTSFLQVKKDIDFLYQRVVNEWASIDILSKNIGLINSRLDILEKKLDLLLLNRISTRNEGVNRRLSDDCPSIVHRSIDSQSTVENLESDQKQPTKPQKEGLEDQKETPEPLNLPKIRPERQPIYPQSTNVQPLDNLSKKQLLMYISIFRLQNELKRPLTYLDIAQKTELTESGVKYLIRTLSLCKVPLLIYRNPDNINCISIPKELQSSEFERHIMDLLDSIYRRRKSKT